MKKKAVLTFPVLFMVIAGILFAGGSTESKKGEGFAPAKDVEWYCTSSPGGGSDIFTRTIIDVIAKEKLLDTNFVVVYKTDGAGEVGRLQVSRIRTGSQANNTLLTFNSGDLWPMVKNTGQRIKNFTPISHMAADKHLVFKGEYSKYNTFNEVINAVKAGQKVVMAGSKGDDIACYEALIEELGFTKNQVAYIINDSSADAITSILGGHVDLLISKPAASSQYVEAGKITPILALAKDRFSGNLASAPKLSEIGAYKDIELPNWRSVVGPENMSKEAALFWSNILKKVSESDLWRNGYIEKFKLVPGYMDHEEFVKYAAQFQTDYMKSIGIEK